MINLSSILALLLSVKSICSQSFDYRPSLDLDISWNKTVPLSFDVNEYCISKCYNTEFIYVTHDPTVTDYYTFLQSAIVSLSENGGGTLFLSAGTYPVGTQINLDNNICIVGEGYTLSIIKLIDNATPFARSGFIRDLKHENITVSDITLDGNRLMQFTDVVSSYGRYGFYSEVSNYVFLNKVQINSFQGYGFDPHGNKTLWAEYLVIMDCLANDNGIDGFTLDQTHNITFANNIAKDNDRHGVNVVTGSTFGTIVNNNVTDNGFVSLLGCGITLQNNELYNTSDWSLSGNILNDNYADEICIRDVVNVEITDNIVSKNTSIPGYCFLVENSTDIIITDNSCYARNFLNDKNNIGLVESDNIKRAPSTPDPKCDNGIFNKGICCVKECLSCGGPTCSTDPLGAESCCTNIIQESLYSCLDYSAPCIIGYIAPILPPNTGTVAPTVNGTVAPTEPINGTVAPTRPVNGTLAPTRPVNGTVAPTRQPTAAPTSSGSTRKLSELTIVGSFILLISILV